MPGQDRTGPSGMGPMTGRGLGPYSRGLGFRRGFGRGFGFRQIPIQVQPQVITEADEKKILQEDLEILKQEMAEIQKRLKELK